MQKFFILLFVFLWSASYAQLDPTTENVWEIQDSISGGSLSIHLDKDLETLLKSKEKTVCERVKVAPPRPLTPAEKCATQQKIMGYKIQIMYTKDRETAMKAKNDFAKLFPGLTTEISFASPDWRVLVGDYFTRESARADLRKVQKTFPGAFTVQWRVWCRRAN